MNIENTVYKNMEMITGLPEEELRGMPELDLQENELMDSLSTAELISAIAADLGKTIDLKKFKAEDFTTINGIIAAVKAQCE